MHEREGERERERDRDTDRQADRSLLAIVMQAELERLQQSGHTTTTTTTTVEERGDHKQQAALTPPRSPYTKIVTENERLRKELKKVGFKLKYSYI